MSETAAPLPTPDPATLPEGSLKDTLEALQSARQLVSDLEYRVEQLSLGDYDSLKALAELLHRDECTYDHTEGCSWGYEERAADPWFADAHQRWIERARRRVMVANMPTDEFIGIYKTVAEARTRAGDRG